MNHSGLTVAIDPVDGTWAFLTGTETYTMVLALFRDGTPVLGMVSNPSTGQLGYATRGGESRLVQLSLFGEPDSASSLPDYHPRDAAVLVNVHPSRRGRPLVKALYEAWQQESIRMVRSPGGSPSWALFRCAFLYLPRLGHDRVLSEKARGQEPWARLCHGASAPTMDIS